MTDDTSKTLKGQLDRWDLGPWLDESEEIEWKQRMIKNQKIVDEVIEMSKSDPFPTFVGDTIDIVPEFCKWVLEEYG